MKNFIILFFLIGAIFSTDAKETRELTLEKIWKQGTFRQKSVSGLKSMQDGIHYTVLENIEEEQQINKYSYEKEKLVSTILANDLKND